MIWLATSDHQVRKWLLDFNDDVVVVSVRSNELHLDMVKSLHCARYEGHIHAFNQQTVRRQRINIELRPCAHGRTIV